MTSFQAIGFSILGGLVVSALSILAFGLAVLFHHVAIAPKCAARPPDTLYTSTPKEECQDRGNAWTGWIRWVMKLSYDTMLKGIPGTGSTDDGLDGDMLYLNLDYIVLFRFCALCLRVAVVTSFLVIIIVLPINWTANPFNTVPSFPRTTLANIPSLSKDVPDVTINPDDIKGTVTDLYLNLSASPGIQARLYTIVVVSWIVYYYICIEIGKEWSDNLALRRKYYLEANHHRQEKLRTEQQRRPEVNKDGELRDLSKEQLRERRRDPWVRRPELRDTVANVELYSVLVRNLPSLPSEIVDEKDIDTAVKISQQQNLDWQLAVATAFFDHCVPNQPGFSSSVAAVTILPKARELAVAWRRWYRAARALRRLRFVRSIIADRCYFDIDDSDDDSVNANGLRESNDLEAGTVSSHRHSTHDASTITSLKTNIFLEENDEDTLTSHKSNLREFYGDTDNEDFENQLLEARQFGPQQIAAYSREHNVAAGGCCPNGCFENGLRRKDIRELQKMEQQAIENLCKANKELQDAQGKAGFMDEDTSTIANFESTPNVGSSTDLNRQWGSAQQNSGQLEPEGCLTEHTSNATLTCRHNLSPYAAIPEHSMTDENSYEAITSERDLCDETKRHDNTTENISAIPEDATPSPSPYQSLNSQSTNTSTPYARTQQSLSSPYQASDCLFSSMAINKQGKIYFKMNKNDLVTDDDEDHEQQSMTLYYNDNNLHFSNFKRPFTLSQGHHETPPPPDESKKKRRTLIRRGVWGLPSLRSTSTCLKYFINRPIRFIKRFSNSTTCAVVTFTNRQAAIAARQCIADGRGVGRWASSADIPVPPLADAAPCDCITCRITPVTLTISTEQQVCRKIVTFSFLALIYVFYTPIITAIVNLANVENLTALIPSLSKMAADNPYFYELFSGIVPSALYAALNSGLPIFFKAIANFGSNAKSQSGSELSAMEYYWWMVLCITFTGSTIASAVINGFNEGYVTNNAKAVLLNIANTIPVQVSGYWLNNTIFYFAVSIPLFYLFPSITFLFTCIRWKFMAKLFYGQGNTGPLPYRIYIDMGTIFMCLIALSFASPLVAPFAAIYFLVCQPVWRRNCIYIYTPIYDGGGFRWPFLSDVCFSCIFLAQVLLMAMMFLKRAVGPSFLALLPMLPTAIYRHLSRKQYLAAYDDAGLLQTSLLDMWDTSAPKSMEEREDFRKFLVDAHKAAYIPVCIAGTSTGVLTHEPAVVVPVETDNPSRPASPIKTREDSDRTFDSRIGYSSVNSSASLQPGRSFRRIKQKQIGTSNVSLVFN